MRKGELVRWIKIYLVREDVLPEAMKKCWRQKN